ncbi:MAG: DNA-protecting protein DprA [Candidatus Vogelbacteria bacterium]|nr:DNA-protecting protein DprA [Candidatus Vogelbacteria bacterium]
MRTIEKENIPTSLQEIPEPPTRLYIEGELPNAEHFIYLAVVGSRRYSNYGREACEHLIAGLSGSPIVIVSGLAHGIDALAHRAALSAKLPTVAFPGSGLDRRSLYPRSNIGLADEILAAGGALVSEFEPMTRGALHTFPRRNRLMAGISRAVLVVEAGERSGTLITARLAIEYNRDLFTVPGSIFSEHSIGAHRLLRHGAVPITTSADLLLELGIENKRNASPLVDGLTINECRVLEALHEPLERDALLRTLPMPIAEANALLMTMEIRGLISESVGRFRKTNNAIQ